MALPKIKQPTYIFTTFKDKKDIEFRPYTVGEEKILMTIRDSDDAQLVANNIKKVIQNCILTPDFRVENLQTYDIELLLLKIRGKSQGEIVEAKYTDPDTNKTFNIEIDLDKVYIKENEKHNYKIELAGGQIVLLMTDLPFEKVIEYQKEKNDTSVIFEAIIDCVKAIYDKSEDKTYTIGVDTTRKELEEFIDSLSGESQKLFEFLETIPKVSYDLKLPSGKEVTISDINSFLG